MFRAETAPIKPIEQPVPQKMILISVKNFSTGYVLSSLNNKLFLLNEEDATFTENESNVSTYSGGLDNAWSTLFWHVC